MDYRIEAVVLSTTNTEAMVRFYANVFGITFEAEEVSGHAIHTGKASGLTLTLVPAELSGIGSPNNPAHYDVYVSDLEAGIDLVKRHGGRTNERLGEDERERAIGIFDPDGNFMVFKQRKTPMP